MKTTLTTRTTRILGWLSAISLALTPEHSASHSNHFHLATGRYFRCGF